MHKTFQWMEKRLWWILPLLAIIIYSPTHQAGLVHDFTGWYERYMTYGFEGIWHCFGYHRLQHVMHTIHFLIFKICGNEPFCWYIVYSLMFGYCSFLVYKVSQALIDFVNLRSPGLPLLTSLLFLIHPYHTTAVVWKVCFHYLLATSLILLTILLTLRWIKKPNKKHLIWIYVFYTLALFTHELTVSIPLMSLVLFFMLVVQKHQRQRKTLLFLVLPQFLLLPLYFSATPYLLSETGKEVLLSEHEIKPDKQIAAVFRYASKHIFFTRYWRHPAKERFHQAWNKKKVWIPVFITTLGLFALFFYFYRRSSNQLKLLMLSLLLFAMAIAPFTSAYESYLLYTTNDMYGFSASPFIVIAIVAFANIFRVRIRNVLLLLYACLSFIFLVKTLFYWHASGKVMNSLLEDFRWYDQEKVYVLASPDNFRGVLMMKSHDTSMLDDHLLVRNNQKPECKIEDIIQFNMKKSSDGVQAVVHSSDSLTIKFNQWGTWHWRHGIGASSYESDNFKVDLAIPNYHLKRKNTESNAVFIYQDGLKWKEVSEWSTD